MPAELERAPSGRLVHWGELRTVRIYLHEPLSDEGAVVGAARQWGLDLYTSRMRSRAQVVVRIANAEEWTAGESVIAHTHCEDDATTGQRNACEIRLTPRWSELQRSLDLQCVLVHEWGHVMGLKHSVLRQEAMYPGHAFTTPCDVNVLDSELALAASASPESSVHARWWHNDGVLLLAGMMLSAASLRYGKPAISMFRRRRR